MCGPIPSKCKTEQVIGTREAPHAWTVDRGLRIRPEPFFNSWLSVRLPLLTRSHLFRSINPIWSKSHGRAWTTMSHPESSPTPLPDNDWGQRRGAILEYGRRP